MAALKENPFFLDDEAVAWVQNTIAGMTLEEKIGQLFFNMGASREEAYLKACLENFHIGGVRYNPGPSDEIYEQNRILQENAKIPLLIACNTEGGGDGACTDGTHLGMPVKIGATGDARYAYALGRMANREAAALGCNLSFAPLSDIHQNWHNPIISKRCFSKDADVVAEMTQAYLRGAHENPGFACAAKHFPGDGLDERDQHLSLSVNSAGCEEWMETYGKVYKGLIDSGVEAVMAGHIFQPAWSKALNPKLRDEDLLPATLSPELLQGLLRGKLGFNGVIVTDASHMVGMTSMMKRRDLLPAAIAAGCDMFLFFNDMDEDFGYMLEGYRRGVITAARLQEALERILGLKAKLGLHKKRPTEILPPREQMHEIIGCPAHKAMAEEISQKAITLVKNKQDVLPIRPEQYRRIRIVPVKGAGGGGIFSVLSQRDGPSTAQRVQARLEQRGFQVEIYEDPLSKMLEHKQQEAALARAEGREPEHDPATTVMVYFGGKSSVADFVGEQDLVLTLSEVNGSGQTAERVAWAMSKGGGQIPWYVHELPVVVVSVGHPFLLADVPQAQTYINAYDAEDSTLDALVARLCGDAPFTGVDPVDSYCGLWDTRL